MKSERVKSVTILLLSGVAAGLTSGHVPIRLTLPGLFVLVALLSPATRNRAAAHVLGSLLLFWMWATAIVCRSPWLRVTGVSLIALALLAGWGLCRQADSHHADNSPLPARTVRWAFLGVWAAFLIPLALSAWGQSEFPIPWVVLPGLLLLLGPAWKWGGVVVPCPDVVGRRPLVSRAAVLAGTLPILGCLIAVVQVINLHNRINGAAPPLNRGARDARRLLLDRSEALGLERLWIGHAEAALEHALETGPSNAQARRAAHRILARFPSHAFARATLLTQQLRSHHRIGSTMAALRSSDIRVLSLIPLEDLLQACEETQDWRPLARLWSRLDPSRQDELVAMADLWGLALALRSVESSSDAIELLGRCTHLEPKTARLLAWLRIDQGDYDKALLALDSSMTQDLNHVDSYVRAVIATSQGDRPSASEWAQDVIARDPGHVGARRILDNQEWRPNLPAIGSSVSIHEARARVERVSSGPLLSIDFTWEASLPVDPTWKVFVHMVQDTYGGGTFHADHRFSDYHIDPRHWSPGTLRQYRLERELPEDLPPGVYHVFVGIWDGTKNQMIEGTYPSANLIVSPGNRIRLAQEVEL